MNAFCAVAVGVGEWLCTGPLLEALIGSKVKPLLEGHLSVGYERRPRFLLRGLAYERRPLPRLSGTPLEAKIELHRAERAGDHLDFRIEMPDGTTQDFAVAKRTEFPTETGKVFKVVPTPNHSRRYFRLDGRWAFAEGYGKGTVETAWRGQIDVAESSPGKMEFVVPDGPFAGRFFIRRLPKGWVLGRMKETDGTPYWVEREPFANSEAARRRMYAEPEAVVAEVKENGAHYELIPGPKENLLLSRRLSVDGKVIDRRHYLPALRDAVFPKKFWGRRVHVEVISGTDDLETSPSTTAGLLNAKVALSRANQRRLGKPLRAVAFNIEGEGGYLERKAELRELAATSPRIDLRRQGVASHRFLCVRLRQPRVLEVVRDNLGTGEDPQSFVERLKAEGYEGGVLKRRDGRYRLEEPTKDKAHVDDIDLRVVGFEEGRGKFAGELGALVCEDPATGARTKVGTGFTDFERWWIWEHREAVKGGLVKVQANWKIASTGSYHGPRWRGFHPESGVVLDDEQALLDYAEASSEEGKMMEAKYRMISSRGWRAGR